MTYFPVSSPFTIFTDTDGAPLESGYIYIGEAYQNPITNPITVTWDNTGLYPAAQPIRIIAGYPDRNGSAANIFFDSTASNGDYSILIQDKNLNTIFSSQSIERSGLQFTKAINIIDDLRAYTSFTFPVYIRGHSAAGDGGQGIFEYFDDGVPGTYTDDDGTIIVPSGGDGSAAWKRMFVGAVSPMWFDPSDVGNAINLAQAAGYFNILLPQGTVNALTTAQIESKTTVSTDGTNDTIYSIDDDIDGFLVVGSYTKLKGFIINTSVAHTSSGIIVGSLTDVAGRCNLSDLYIDGMGSDGITIVNGNLGYIENITAVNNGQDGIRFTDTAVDNNAWAFSGRIDLNANTRHGLYFEGGTGPSDANASRQHYGGLITAQNNGGDGVLIESRSNVLNIYSEANTGNEVHLTSIAYGNRIFLLEGTVTDDGGGISNGNTIFGYSEQANYLSYMSYLLTLDGIRFSNKDYIGTLELKHTSNRNYQAIMGGGTAADQTITFINDNSSYSAIILGDYFVGKCESNGISLFVDGDATPSINEPGTNIFKTQNTGATTITSFDNRFEGQVFTIIINDANTTIADSASIQLAGGVNFVGTVNDTITFVIDGTTAKEICRSVN
ncbi:MAG: hypothetical protein ACWGNO_00030 [Desulfobacterales bacterium]